MRQPPASSKASRSVPDSAQGCCHARRLGRTHAVNQDAALHPEPWPRDATVLLWRADAGEYKAPLLLIRCTPDHTAHRPDFLSTTPKPNIPPPKPDPPEPPFRHPATLPHRSTMRFTLLTLAAFAAGALAAPAAAPNTDGKPFLSRAAPANNRAALTPSEQQQPSSPVTPARMGRLLAAASAGSARAAAGSCLSGWPTRAARTGPTPEAGSIRFARSGGGRARWEVDEMALWGNRWREVDVAVRVANLLGQSCRFDLE